MKKQGFTLIELMLVVMIVGLVYGLAVSGMKRYSDKAENLSLMTLPDFVEGYHQQNHVTVICIDRCRECTLYVDGKAVKELEPFVDEKAEYYRFDQRLLTRELTWLPLYREDGVEEEVCFRYDMYRNGSRSEMMIKYGKSVIDFPGYFGTTKRYASIEEAVDAKQALIEEVLQ